MEWWESTSQYQKFINNVSSTPLVISLPRPVPVKLNRFRTDIGLFRSETHKWGMTSMAVSNLVCQYGDMPIFGHSIDHPAPVHIPQINKEKKS